MFDVYGLLVILLFFFFLVVEVCGDDFGFLVSDFFVFSSLSVEDCKRI